MTDSTRQAELLDQFLDVLLREPGYLAHQELDEETARFARAVALVERSVAPDPRMRDRVWQRTLAAARAEATSAPSWTRGLRAFAGLRPAHVISVAAVLLLVLGIGLWSSPGVRAHMERLLCFVPGLGIRACKPTALVATGPASVSRDEATLTIKNFLSAGGETTVQVEITGLPSTPSVSPQEVRLVLRDERGKTYPPAPGVWSMGGGSRAAAAGRRQPAPRCFAPRPSSSGSTTPCVWRKSRSMVRPPSAPGTYGFRSHPSSRRDYPRREKPREASGCTGSPYASPAWSPTVSGRSCSSSRRLSYRSASCAAWGALLFDRQLILRDESSCSKTT